MLSIVQREPAKATKAKDEDRSYTKVPGTTYFLPSDHEERIRLAIQHNVILKSIRNTLVHAPVNLKDGDSVLESATGSGIWLLDLARTIPKNIELTGIDIEPGLFPEPGILPQNIQFQVHSVLNLPKSWTNKFTFAHQRLIFAGLRSSDWPVALRELYRVLRPGGWIQLFEVENWIAGPATDIMRSLILKLCTSRGIGFCPWGSAGIRRVVEATRFVDIRVTKHFSATGVWAGQDGIDGKEGLLGFYRGAKYPILKAGGFGIVNEEGFDRLLEDVEREIDCTPGAGGHWMMICAQKPFACDEDNR